MKVNEQPTVPLLTAQLQNGCSMNAPIPCFEKSAVSGKADRLSTFACTLSFLSLKR